MAVKNSYLNGSSLLVQFYIRNAAMKQWVIASLKNWLLSVAKERPIKVQTDEYYIQLKFLYYNQLYQSIGNKEHVHPHSLQVGRVPMKFAKY